MALVVPIVVALVTFSFAAWVVLLLAMEAAVLTLLPRSPRFRRAVDAHLGRLERAEAAAARAALLVRIRDEHRLELENLEALASHVRERCGPATAGDDWLGLDRLLMAYARIAVAYRANIETFGNPEAASGLALHHARLERTLADGSEAARPWVQQRLAIAKRRLEAWARAQAERERMAHGLATIAETVRWLYEESASTRADAVRAEVDDALLGLEHTGSTLRDVAALCNGLDSVELVDDVAPAPVVPLPTRVAAEPVEDEPEGAPLPRASCAG